MSQFDLPLDQLEGYLPPLDIPTDFDSFWQETLAQARSVPINARFTPVETGFQLTEAFDVTFNGFGGQPIKGWLILPRERSKPLPCYVQYHGYSSGRGQISEYLFWAATGYAHFVMDNRGQSGYLAGSTPDIEAEAGNPHYPGFLTQGILDPQRYYYRRLFTDAVRAIEAARSHPEIDPQRVGIGGGSQGGGITLAAAALEPSIQFAMIDVPFLCHYRVATALVDTYPYGEISRYCSSPPPSRSD